MVCCADRSEMSMNNSSKDASNEWRDHGETAEAPEQGAEEDLALIARAQTGDLRAFDELVTRHRGKVHAMIRNMIHHEADAWDLSQEVFIKAWNALPRFEARARFSTWIYRIAHNTVYDWTRRRKIDAVGELDDGIFERESIASSSRTTPFAACSPDEALEGGELRVHIERALAKLSEEHREVVVLKDAHGLAYKEIADVMNTSLGTVMSRLHYARKKLQTLLKDEYESR
jgi:RNA polymerase sigma-70 factor, ECF subfamily